MKNCQAISHRIPLLSSQYNSYNKPSSLGGNTGQIGLLPSQYFIRAMEADRQAQQKSYTEIHQNNPINRANSRNITNEKA